MSKFKVGDRVVCHKFQTIRNGVHWIPEMEPYVGCIGTLDKQWAVTGNWYVHFDNDVSWSFPESALTPAPAPHKHAELIKAWADNPKLKLQWRELGIVENWIDVTGSPAWSINVEYRIKPEPKPDVVVLGMLELEGDGDLSVCVDGFGRWDNINIKAVFDGETKRLKDLCIYNRDSEK